ncbi:Uncharacterised protein [Salmonella enterica subsp. enterica serovar Bovismorbificans]|uniref:Uncharacterized protein n=1 Tax=Salmonella enterica subsp. enterica serovar Bovismorbificans TaxID=58097 RepID=A0A655BX19_SALET|nr:Uncharacterised protein [Salmonella enterica subsp. enterica serovar Bovismorbificans]
MKGITQVGDTDALYARKVIARAAVGDVSPFLQAVADKRREQRHRRPVTMADIANIAAFYH